MIDHVSYDYILYWSLIRSNPGLVKPLDAYWYEESPISCQLRNQVRLNHLMLDLERLIRSSGTDTAVVYDYIRYSTGGSTIYRSVNSNRVLQRFDCASSGASGDLFILSDESSKDNLSVGLTAGELYCTLISLMRGNSQSSVPRSYYSIVPTACYVRGNAVSTFDTTTGPRDADIVWDGIGMFTIPGPSVSPCIIKSDTALTLRGTGKAVPAETVFLVSGIYPLEYAAPSVITRYFVPTIYSIQDVDGVQFDHVVAV
jgi:hypothetical protein